MAAYATAERLARTAGFRAAPTVAQREQHPGFDVFVAHLADLVAERVAARLAAPPSAADEWLDTRDAAEYLGVHRDTVRRLAAERVVPSEQDGPGCKLFFRRSDLDAWRCSDRRHVRVLAGGRS